MSLIDLFLKLANYTPVVGKATLEEVNRVAINHFAASTSSRPRPFSLWSATAALPPAVPPPPPPPLDPEYITDYASWPGLTNKEYSARHLGPADPASAYVQGLPTDTFYDGTPATQLGEVTSLFQRSAKMTPSRSSLLFMFFAQWFTDSILRIDMTDRRKNTSNHDIDLCQIYGLTEDSARALRKVDASGNLTGELRSQQILVNGQQEEFLENLCEESPPGSGKFVVRPEFQQLRAQYGFTADAFVDNYVLGPQFLNRKGALYATGLERGNSTIGYVAISTIFMREHNRIAKQLALNNPGWTGERIFQTARNINIVLLLKLVVEDYINHILGHQLFKLDHTFAEDEKWYRPNWIALEFDLLYRWHGMAPDTIVVNGDALPSNVFRNNNALLQQIGIGNIIDVASRQTAGKIGLGNTPDYLLAAECWSIKMSRLFRIRPYNEYRQHFGLAPVKSFTDLTGDRTLQAKLTRLYQGNIDNLELVIGLFGEDAADGSLFGDLLNRMVAYDAFTQIFTNPLLSRHIYGPDTFSPYGLQVIDETTSIEDLVNRNVATPVRASLAVLPGP